ncbi:MAG: flagellar biosynthetic protein FliR [Spirochaetes bacterium]|nr:flagellar biosynthetic protein FliR [Spirochaetota bacterium]
MRYFVYHFQVFLLIMIRLNAMFVIAPFFSSDVIPFRMKILLCFFTTLVIFPVVASQGYRLPGNMAEYSILILREVGIGLYLGFLVAVVFSAFQLAGQFFAVQIGFGINEVLDPLGQVSVPLLGQLKNLIGILVFLAINGHHMMIRAIYRSYDLAPVFQLSVSSSGSLARYLMHSFSGMFVVALKIALPVVVTAFLVTISLGILAKVAPQMNIMMFGFPFQIVVSFGILILATPLIVRVMHVALERTFTFVTRVLVHWPI